MDEDDSGEASCRPKASGSTINLPSTPPREAMRLLTLPSQVGEAWGDRSNGNQVWAIVRYGELRTVMLRRSTQPATPQAFNVDKVTIVS